MGVYMGDYEVMERERCKVHGYVVLNTLQLYQE